MTPAAASPRKLLSREERSAQLLAAAAAAFAGRGYAATSMDDVASVAGVTKLIVYRHYESKDALYRAVLDEVATRIADEFVRGMSSPQPRGTAARSLLAAARENPDGFTLLWRHATREPEFADHAAAVRQGAVAAAEGLIGDGIGDDVVRVWAARTIVSYLVEATLHWLDHGRTERDDEYVERTTAGLQALYDTWAG